MRKIRVMQLVWRFSTGGAERMVINFHNAFNNDEEIEIKTLSLSPQGNDIFEGEIVDDENIDYIPKYWADRAPKLFAKIIKKLFYRKYRKKWILKEIEDFLPDIVHIHLAYLASELSDFCRKLPKNIRIIYHLHSMPEAIGEGHRKRIRKAIEDGIYYPICVTELQKNSAKVYYNILEDAPIIYNGIDQSRFINCKMTNSDIQLFKKDLGIEDDAYVIGTIGRGAPIKNYPHLARSAAEVAKKHKTVLLIVGEIPEELKIQIMKNAVDVHVVFTGQRKDTEKLYQIMDVFALASFYESSSIVSVEAQLSGLPCVISDRISDEVIISNEVIKLSPNASPFDWARALVLQARKKATVTQLERFDFNSSVIKLKNTYKRLLENHD